MRPPVSGHPPGQYASGQGLGHIDGAAEDVNGHPFGQLAPWQGCGHMICTGYCVDGHPLGHPPSPQGLGHLDGDEAVVSGHPEGHDVPWHGCGHICCIGAGAGAAITVCIGAAIMGGVCGHPVGQTDGGQYVGQGTGGGG